MKYLAPVRPGAGAGAWPGGPATAWFFVYSSVSLYILDIFVYIFRYMFGQWALEKTTQHNMLTACRQSLQTFGLDAEGVILKCFD